MKVRIDGRELRRVLDADGEFEIDTGKINISYARANNTLKISGKVKIEIDGASEVNIGGESAAGLVTEKLINWLNSHTHPAIGGSTGAPTVLAVAQNFTTKILKAK